MHLVEENAKQLVSQARFRYNSTCMRFPRLLSKIGTIVLLAVFLSGIPSAHAQWVRISDPLVNHGIQTIAVHPSHSGTIYAGSNGAIYRSNDSGQSWKRVLKLKSTESTVHQIYIPKDDPLLLLAGTDEGLYLSRTNGKSWKRVFHQIEETKDMVRSVYFEASSESLLIVGTSNGLFVSKDEGKKWAEIGAFEGDAVFQVARLSSEERLLVSTKDGLFVSGSNLHSWQRLYAGRSRALPEGNAQTEIIEQGFPVMGNGVYFMVSPHEEGSILMAHERHIIESNDHGKTWVFRSVNGFPSGVLNRPRAHSGSENKVFVPTESGVYLYDRLDATIEEISWGLPSNAVYDIAYDPGEDVLLAATDRGVYRMSYPESSIYLHVNVEENRGRMREVFAYFDHEPSILVLQRKAMVYAEVHPEKIEEWRRVAKLKPFIPTLGVGYDSGNDETVELDRGGTNDPDTFIIGPEESTSDWGIDLRWDLSELIWNPDQLSIDNRSKLMVQLRDEIMNELTHLYYARRRLQIEAIMSSSGEDLRRTIEREIQIQEYTAGIDALTGGYFSRALDKR